MKEKERVYACMCERVKGVRERDKRRTAPYWLSGSFRGTLGNLSFFLTHILDSVYESSIVRYIAWKPLIDRKWFLGTYNDRLSLCRN